MTSKLKCPFCGEEIKIAGERTTIMSCFNGECCGSGLYGEEAMWQELIQSLKDRKELAMKLAQTTQTLEQSEKCCSAWETQALDYKAETIALSGKLEIARKALEKYADEDMWDTGHRWEVDYIQALFLEHGYKIAKEALEQINSKQD